MNSKHILVLGGSGFLGRAVINELLIRGHRVSGIYHKSKLSDGVKGIQGNIENFQWALIEKDIPDAIIHLARIPGKRKLSRYMAGIRGKRASKRLLKWASALKKPPHILYVSGTLVYGNLSGKIATEASPLKPIAFQRDYFKAEIPFLDQIKYSQIPISIVRPPWIIGAGSWFSQFYYNPAVRSSEITQFGNGKNLMSITHVDDCASQIVDIAEENTHGEIYNLCSCPPVTHEDFIGIVARETGSNIKIMENDDIRRKYGKTVWEALTFSTHVKSTKKIIDDRVNQFPAAEQAIKAVIHQLNAENKSNQTGSNS